MKILVPTDGSERSMKAVRRALELAEKEGAEVTLLAVAYEFRGELEEMPVDLGQSLEAVAQAALDKAKAVFDQKGMPASTARESGLVPANVILKFAEKGKFDHILMGCTGKTGVAKYLIGSTASKVVANAPCSVTVLR